jgi:hypothetical protein
LVPSLRALLQIERKRQRVLQLFHHIVEKLADHAFDAHGREMMTMGRVLAASPRSASQISPGWGFIKQVQDFLFGYARARNIKEILIGEIDHLRNALSGFCRRIRLPLAQSVVQFPGQGFHDPGRTSDFGKCGCRS